MTDTLELVPAGAWALTVEDTISVISRNLSANDTKGWAARQRTCDQLRKMAEAADRHSLFIRALEFIDGALILRQRRHDSEPAWVLLTFEPGRVEELATHIQRDVDGARHTGHYFRRDQLDAALEDYEAR